MSAPKFTVAVADALVDAVAAGCSLADACREAEIAEETVRHWLKRGRREQDTPYSEFADEIDEARARAARRPMDRDEFRGHLERAVRGGSVQAMRLWRDIDRDDGQNGRSGFDELDEMGDYVDQARRRLAERRAATSTTTEDA